MEQLETDQEQRSSIRLSLRGLGAQGERLGRICWTWNQYLKVGGCGSFAHHCQQTFSEIPYAKLVPGAKSDMEGVLSQPSLAGA